MPGAGARWLLFLVSLLRRFHLVAARKHAACGECVINLSRWLPRTQINGRIVCHAMILGDWRMVYVGPDDSD